MKRLLSAVFQVKSDAVDPVLSAAVADGVQDWVFFGNAQIYTP